MTLPYRGAGLDMGGQKVVNAAAGSNPSDLVTFSQLSNAIGGVQWKNSALVATTTNITLSGEQTIDGVTTSGSRVLVKNQTDATQNGVWVSGSGAWTRATDSNSSTNVQNGDAVPVQSGTTLGQTVWQLVSTGTITPGTSAQTWSELAFGRPYTAGRGLTLSSGGQFATTAPLKFAAAIPAGASPASIVHGLGTTDVVVEVYDVSGTYPVRVVADLTVVDANTITLGFGTNPTTGQYRVVVIG